MDIKKLRKKWDSVELSNVKNKMQSNIRNSQQQQKEFNKKIYDAELQKRKVELSTKKESPNAFTRTNQMNQYNAPTAVVPNSIENRVNKMYEKIILKQEAEKDVINQAKRMFENSKNIKTTLSEEKSSLINKPRADAKLGQEDLERLSEMDRKGRLDALKGRNEETFQEANLYALAKSNQQTEKKVNEAEGTKKILPTLEYLGKELGQNTVSSFGQIKATAEHIQGRDKNLKALENAQKYQEAISPLGENINSKFIKNLGMATEGLGQQMPQILLGSTGAGALVGGFTEFSNTYNEMTLENPNNKTKTMVTALLKGTVAGGLEHALGLFGGSKIDDLSKSQLAGIKNKLVRNAMATGYDVAGEITEEQLENIIGYVIDKAVNDKNITMEQAIKEAEATFKQTGLTTLLMSALGLGGNTRGEVNNLRDNLDIIEASNISGTEKKNLKEWVSSENVSNDQLYTQIGKMINENNISEQILEKTVENTQNQQTTMENEAILKQEQQTTLPQSKTIQNQFSQVFEESAKKHQIDTNNDGVRVAKNFTDKANLQLEFEKLGKKTLAVYKNGRVIVNADAIKNNPDKVLQNIVLHEAIHGKSGSRELNDVMKTVLSFAKSKGEYKSARLDLDSIYAEAYKGRPDFEQLMDEEVVTNTLGEYFGTEEGLNELINYVDDRTTLQKIYDFVKDILNRVTGYKDQEQFFRRAERQLAKALQSDYVAKSGDRFSVQSKASNESNVNIKDNKGRTLSKEQQEYFKDSKVRDENGNLLEMYHGSPNGEFTVFRDNSYFSANEEYAKGYENTWASSSGVMKETKTPKTYKVYLNITNPFTLSNPKAKEIYLKEYIKGGNSAYYDPYTDYTEDINNLDEVDWVEGEDLIDWLKENHPEFDGILFDEGGDGGYGEAEYRWRGKSFVPFNSNQIKNVDNTNPTDNPDIRYSLSQDTRKNIESKIDRYSRIVEEMQQEGRDSDEWTPYANEILRLQDQLEDSRYSYQTNGKWQEFVEKYFSNEGTKTKLGDIRLPEKNVLQENTSNLKQTTTKKETDTEIAKVLNTPVTRQKPQDRKWAIFKASVFDKGIVFEDLSKRAKNRELEAKWDYTLSSSARAQYAIGNARLDENGNKISKGLTEIIDEVGDKIDDFQNYMYHLLNIDRMSLKERFGIDNKPVFGKNIGKDYSERKVAEFEKVNPKFKEWAQDVYDYANADKAELVKNGVISQELSDKFAEMYPHYVPIQRANKLSNAINLPLDTRRTGVNTPIKQAKGGSSDLNPLFETLAGRTMQTYRASARNSLGVELKNTLESLNSLNSNVNDAESLDSIMDTMADEKSTSDLLQASKDGKLPTFTVFENGNKVTFDISEDIYDALKPVSKALQGNYLWGIPNKLSNLRRAVLTEYNPLFSITNTVKDTQDVLLNSQHAYKTYKKYPEAYWQIMRNGYWKQEYIQNGGEQNTYFKDGEFEKVTKKGLLKQVVTFPLDAISKVNGALEMAPRLAEYIASREEGRSIQTSMLDASRVTTNFKAGGDVTKALNRNGFTFLNAGVQGAMQAVRNVREANVKGLKGWTMLACKMAVAGAPVLILNNLMWEDDDDYEQLQDYVKDGYYIIGKRNDGTFIRIPKGRTLAVIQKVVSNVDKYINNEGNLNIDEVSKDFWETAKFTIENLAPSNPLDNNVISPIIQTITNTSWYGEDIVPSRLQNVPNAEQFDETTDKFSKWLGEKTGASPMKINYLLDQYGGGVSDVLLPLGTPQAENTPLEDKFVTDPVIKSKYPGEFFDKADKLEVASNSMFATDADIVKGKFMSDIQSDMSELYKEKRKIQNSDTSDEYKKIYLKDIQQQINDLAKESMELVDKAEVNSKVAIIGDKQYYKDDEGKWQKIKESQIVKGLDTKTYADYKNKTSIATDKKRAEKDNPDATLNDSEKSQILLDSSYTEKEKKMIYENYIGKDDTTYSNLKILTGDKVNIEDYLGYKTADLKAEDNPKSNIKGKTISGSKKKKVVEYLNNSKFSGIERLYIYGTQYSFNNSQKQAFVNYVESKGYTDKEKHNIYKKLQDYEEREDGAYRLK